MVIPETCQWLFQKRVMHINLISTFLLLGWYSYNKPENIYGCPKMLSMLMKCLLTNKLFAYLNIS